MIENDLPGGRSSALIPIMGIFSSERDFLEEITREVGISLGSYSPPQLSGNDPYYWANKIRSIFGLDLSFQYKCPSARQFYLYLRSRIESLGIFIHCFTDVPVVFACLIVGKSLSEGSSHFSMRSTL